MINVLVLGTILVLPLARLQLLKLQEQGAATVLPSCACYLANVSTDLCSKGGCARNTSGLELVLNRDRAVQTSEAATL